MIKNIPDHECAGVYALIDEFGKPYIGSSVNVRKRILQHDMTFRIVFQDRKGNGLIAPKLSNAILTGRNFTAQVLKEFSPEDDRKQIRHEEKYFLKLAGGIENTYNTLLPNLTALDSNRCNTVTKSCIKNTDSPKKATLINIQVRLSSETKERWTSEAKKRNKSMNQFIIESVEKEIR